MRCFFNGAEKYKIYATDLAISSILSPVIANKISPYSKYLGL